MDHVDDKRDRILRAALQYRTELTAYARSLLGNDAAAEDAVQEAMLVVVKKYDQFQEGTSILAWCRSIVRLEVLRMKQRHRRERSLAEKLLDDAIDAAFEQYQTARRVDDTETWRDALRGCLEKLPDRAQRVLNSRIVDGLSYQQIADRVGMSLEGVRKSLFRHKKQVRTCVETNLRGTE